MPGMVYNFISCVHHSKALGLRVLKELFLGDLGFMRDRKRSPKFPSTLTPACQREFKCKRFRHAGGQLSLNYLTACPYLLHLDCGQAVRKLTLKERNSYANLWEQERKIMWDLQFLSQGDRWPKAKNRKENNLWPSYDCRYILVKKVMSSSPHYLLTLCTRRWGQTGKMRASVELLLYWLSFSFMFNLQALLDLLFLSFLSLGGDPMLGEDLEWRWEPIVISSVFIFTTIGSPWTTVKHLGFPYLYYLYFEEIQEVISCNLHSINNYWLRNPQTVTSFF